MGPAGCEEEEMRLQEQGEVVSTEELLLPSTGRPWPVRMVSAILLLGALACVALRAGPGRVLLPAQMGRFMSAAETELFPRMMRKVTIEHDETTYTRDTEVDFAMESLTNDSVVIVDDGVTVYLWVGPDHKVNKYHLEENEAKGYARSTSRDRGFIVPEHMEDVKIAVAKALATPLMNEVTVEENKNKTVLISVNLDKDNLDSFAVFIVDTGKPGGVYLWLGQNASQSVVDRAQDVANKKGGGDGVTVIFEGEEKEDAFSKLFDKDSTEETDESEDKDDSKGDDGTKKNGSMPAGGCWSCALLAVASILLMN